MAGNPVPAGLGPAPDTQVFMSLLAEAGRRQAVLDLGFGDGRLRGPVIAAGYEWIGVEVNRIRAGSGRDRGWSVVQADIGAGIPVRDASVDAVMLVCVLNTVADRATRATVVSEVRRVLKPGGMLWLRDFVRLPVPDVRVGADVRVAHWEAMWRRYAIGRQLAALVTARPERRLCAGSFPAFDILDQDSRDRFATHHYDVAEFRAAVADGRIQVTFVACHPTEARLRAEWRPVGEIRRAISGVARTRGGEPLPVVDLFVAMTAHN